MYWAEALAAQDKELTKLSSPYCSRICSKRSENNAELIAAQENPQDIGGHYQPNPEATSKAMRPSETFNNIGKKIALIKLLTIFKRQPETVVFFILAIP
jgi:isocitrate dehydrogenase